LTDEEELKIAMTQRTEGRQPPVPDTFDRGVSGLLVRLSRFDFGYRVDDSNSGGVSSLPDRWRAIEIAHRDWRLRTRAPVT
jgi:hypothetical protein